MTVAEPVGGVGFGAADEDVDDSADGGLAASADPFAGVGVRCAQTTSPAAAAIATTAAAMRAALRGTRRGEREAMVGCDSVCAMRAVKTSLVAVAASAVATHLSALGGGFVWLDHAHIEDRLALAPPQRVTELFTRGFAGTGYYRPLMSLSLSLDAFLGGPFVFHATSLLWHAAAAMLVVLAAQALGLARRAANIAGVLFAVHPATALVADAIAFRSEAMIAVALLGLIWAHVNKKPWLAALAILAGALSKEMAVLLAPLFVAAAEISRARAGQKQKEKQKKKPEATAANAQLTKILFASEAAAFGVVLALRAAYAPAWRATHASLSPSEHVGTRLAALAKSVAAITLPIDRTICDAFRITQVWQPTSLAGAIALAALLYGAWRRRGPALLLALALLPSFQLVPVTRWWSPHYVYVPLAFVAMLVGEGLDRLASKHGGRVLYAAAGAGALLGIVSLLNGRRYADDTALWSPEVAAQPACREGQLFLGDGLRMRREWDGAARRYEAALAPWPGVLAYVDRAAALQNLGVVRVEQHRFGDARVAFKTALEGTRDPKTARELSYNLAAATLSDGDAAGAARLLEEETARTDALPQALLVRALALEALERADEARSLRSRIERAQRAQVD